MKQLSLRHLRLQARKTKKEAADLCDVSLNTYSKYEDDPLAMPHGLYLQLVEYFELSTQIRKANRMSEPIKANVKFVTPEEASETDRIEDYSVPIPEGLTEEFHPSQPVTPQQIIDWETKNKEPYPGYAEEFFNWENAWEKVNRAQNEADGGHIHLSDPVHVDPEFDESTGDAIIYDEVQMAVDPDSGEQVLYIDEADMSSEEIAQASEEEARFKSGK